MLSSAGRLTPPVSVGSYRYKGDAQRLTHPTPADGYAANGPFLHESL